MNCTTYKITRLRAGALFVAETNLAKIEPSQKNHYARTLLSGTITNYYTQPLVSAALAFSFKFAYTLFNFILKTHACHFRA